MQGPNRDKMSAHRRTMLSRLAADRRLDNRERAHEAALALECMDAGRYGFCLLCGLGRIDSPNVKPLIPDARNAQAQWYKRTGLYPINHTIVVKDDLLASDPSLAARLFRAWREAKEQWLSKATAEERANAGANIVEDDPIPYGISRNRKAIETVISFAHDQKILPRRFSIEEVFAKGTEDLE